MKFSFFVWEKVRKRSCLAAGGVSLKWCHEVKIMSISKEFQRYVLTSSRDDRRSAGWLTATNQRQLPGAAEPRFCTSPWMSLCRSRSRHPLENYADMVRSQRPDTSPNQRVSDGELHQELLWIGFWEMPCA